MEEDLLAHLVGNAALTNLVGDRIQWSVREDAPSLALHLIDAPTDRTLQGVGGLVIARVQADCWGLTFLSAKAIGEALAAALPAKGQVIGATRFLCCAVIDVDRGRFGESPNILFRTRIDLRVTFQPA